MDSILIWNTRGLNNLDKQKEVRQCIASHNAKLVCLLETKVRAQKLGALYLNVCPGWCITSNIPSNGRGRVVLAWDATAFQVNIIKSTAQMVHCEITPNINKMTFRCTFVYAFNGGKDRETLWKDMCNLADSSKGPWLVGGDFNTVLTNEERIGARPNKQEVADFANCLSYCKLEDVKFNGRFFTWTNKQDGEARVMSKLDRILANAEWMHSFVTAEVTFMPEGYFDHCPAVIRCYGEVKGHKRFRFFNMWSKADEFHDLVSEE